MFTLFLPFCGIRADVIISEIHYHPSSEDPREEFVEIWNTDAVARDVGGWRLGGGVEFAFPAGTSIAAGGFVVVAADAATFSAKHPGVANFVGGWSGRLSSSADTIRLRNSADVVVAEVSWFSPEKVDALSAAI